MRAHFVSLGLWPKDSVWRSRQLTTHSLEKVHWDWISKFPILELPKEMETWTSLDIDQVVEYYVDARFGQNSPNRKSMMLQDDDSDRLWRNVMLWCLKYRKKQALLLLLATLKNRKFSPPRYVVSDSLTFLARHFLFGVSDPDPVAVEEIWHLTRKYIDGANDQEQHFTVPQHLVYLVLQHSGDLRALSFFWLLSLNKAVLHADTMVRFLCRFIDMGRFKLAMRLLGTIVNTGYDLSYDQVQMACVKFLRAPFDRQQEYSVRSQILTQILEMGIRPKLPMFNTILLNAGEGGDFASAWEMYCLAREHNLEPDQNTYKVLVKGAELSGEVSNIDLVLHEVQTTGVPLGDLRLVSVALKAISRKSPGDEFGAMLDFYKQHCDIRPLQDLSILGDQIEELPGANSDRVWPDHVVLTQMILAYLKLRRGSLWIEKTYKLYYKHVKENHPLIAPLAQEDAVPNAFILAFGQKSSTLQHCITVVKHMLELSSQPDATCHTVAYSAPTVQTWSILAGAYFHNRQRRAAEKVLDMMRERGIQYDEVTWNILISQYARLQDADEVVKAVKGMEAAGFEADAHTIKGLGKMWSHDRLMEALKSNLTDSSAIKGTLEGLLPPKGRLPLMDSDEQSKASNNLESELTRVDDVRSYYEAKSQEYLDTESMNPSKCLVAIA